MKRVFLGLLASTLIVSGCGIVSGATKQTQPKPEQPNIKQIFLNYVPPNEPVAPHDMEYLLDEYAGDKGYYHTGQLPGMLSISYNPKYHYYDSLMNGGKAVYASHVYVVNWNFDDQKLTFIVFPLPKQIIAKDGTTSYESIGPYAVAPLNDLSQNLADAAYSAQGVKPSTIQDLFLGYIPPNESGAPHDLEWIIDNQLGYGGYYGTEHLIGTLNISPDPSMKPGDYNVSLPTKHSIHVDEAFKISWNINGMKLLFELTQPSNEVEPMNQDAELFLYFPTDNSSN